MIRVTIREGLEGRYSIEVSEPKIVGQLTDYMTTHYAVGFLNGVISGLELSGEDFEINFKMRTTQESSRIGLEWLQDYLIRRK